jgi:hypothetical protein
MLKEILDPKVEICSQWARSTATDDKDHTDDVNDSITTYLHEALWAERSKGTVKGSVRIL